MKLLVRLGALLACAAIAGPAFAGTGSVKQAPHDARARWDRMPHQERAEFVQRFEKFRALPPEERAKLAERAKRLEGLRAELVENLQPEARARLEQLTPLERVEALREFMEHRLGERGRHVRGFLPRELRERIEQAPPEERERLVREFCEHARREEGPRMLAAMTRRLELPAEEVARIESLPEAQRFEAVMELRRRMIARDVAEEGVPAWLDATEWAELERLPTRAFFERFHDLRRDRCGKDHDGGPGGPRFGPSRRGDLPGLRELLAPDPAWLAAAEQLPAEERKAFVDGKLRERILERLAERPELVSTEELEALRAKSGPEFQPALRDALRRKAGSRGSREHTQDR